MRRNMGAMTGCITHVTPDNQTILSLLFGVEQCLIGAGDQRLDIRRPDALIHGCAETRGDAHVTAFGRYRAHQTRPQAFDDPHNSAAIGFGQQHNNFLAAIASKQVNRAQFTAKDAADRLQHLITNR
jgi:hypothetical protein